MRFVFVAAFLGLASGCQPDEYLLTGPVATAGEFRLLSDGSVFLGGELSLERGADSANHGSLRLWTLPGGCELDVQWPIDARGDTDATGSLSCPDFELLDGKVTIVDLEVDASGDTSSEVGARLTIDVGGLRLGGAPVAEGRGTLSFGSLATSGAGGGGGAAGGGGGGGGGGGSSADGGATTARLDLEGTASVSGTLRLVAQTSQGELTQDFDSLKVTAARWTDDGTQPISVSFTAYASQSACALTLELLRLDGTSTLGQEWMTSGVTQVPAASTSCSLTSADGLSSVSNLTAFTPGTVQVSGTVTPGYRPEVGQVSFSVDLQGSSQGLVASQAGTMPEPVTVRFVTSGVMTDTVCTLQNGQPCEPTGGGAGSGGGAGGGGGSSGGSCADVPLTYIGDVQFDSICAVAVCYQRTGNTTGVRASCQQLSLLSGPPPSQCPAC